MIRSFLIDNKAFTNYGIEHVLCCISIIIFIIVVLKYANKYWNTNQQRLYITIFCSIGLITQIFKIFYRLHIGTFNIAEDLPLHLCNVMTLIMPVIVWKKWQKAWGAVFFWIILGCSQSLFTPTLTESLPNYEAIRYWVAHGMIILGALYGSYVYKFKLSWHDAVRAIVVMNIWAALLYPINIILGSNYMYLNGKPPGKTFYDLLGPWPQYILVIEVLIVFLFSILLIPFYWDDIKIRFKKIYFQ